MFTCTARFVVLNGCSGGCAGALKDSAVSWAVNLSDIKYGNRSFCDKSTKLGRNTHLDELVNLRYGGFSDMAYFANNAHVKNRYCMKTRLNKKIAF